LRVYLMAPPFVTLGIPSS